MFRPRMTTTFVVLLGMASALIACSAGSEEVGRMRVRAAQVIGIYQLELNKGSERLELRTDGTFSQDTILKSKPFHHTGKWRIEDELFDDSEVVLIDAAIVDWPTPGSENPALRFSDLSLRAHNRAGKVALARNEIADWYYEPKASTALNHLATSGVVDVPACARTCAANDCSPHGCARCVTLTVPLPTSARVTAWHCLTTAANSPNEDSSLKEVPCGQDVAWSIFSQPTQSSSSNMNVVQTMYLNRSVNRKRQVEFRVEYEE